MLLLVVECIHNTFIFKTRLTEIFFEPHFLVHDGSVFHGPWINLGKIGIKTNSLIGLMFGSDLGSFY